MRRRGRNGERGMTMLEVLVVLGIVALLWATAYPRVAGAPDRVSTMLGRSAPATAPADPAPADPPPADVADLTGLPAVTGPAPSVAGVTGERCYLVRVAEAGSTTDLVPCPTAP